jgi:hypothetical protein
MQLVTCQFHPKSLKQHAHNSHRHCWHHHVHGCYGRLLCFRWFMTTSFSKVGSHLLKNWSSLSYFEQTLGLVHTCGCRLRRDGEVVRASLIATAMVIREAVHACGQRCSSVQWSELMLEVDYGGWSRWWRWRHACKCGPHVEQSCGWRACMCGPHIEQLYFFI